LKYQAVLFDLDGTLLNTLDDLAASANRVLQRHSFPTHPVQAYRHYVGDGAGMLVTRMLPPDQRDEITHRRCLEEFLADYGANFQVKTQPYPGILDMLQDMQARRVRGAIFSNKPHDITQALVQALLPAGLFEVVLGATDDLPRKPDPAGALQVVQEMELPAESFVYLGDSGTDMLTASAAGMYPVGALWGFRSRDELRENGAQRVINRPQELMYLFATPSSTPF
jgi:phosphoglycolate phosphatase